WAAEGGPPREQTRTTRARTPTRRPLHLPTDAVASIAADPRRTRSKKAQAQRGVLSCGLVTEGAPVLPLRSETLGEAHVEVEGPGLSDPGSRPRLQEATGGP